MWEMCAQKALSGRRRPRPCTSCGHRAAAKNFHSEKHWMRTGVLRDVFLIPLRQSGSFSWTSSGKIFFFFLFTCQSHCRVSSLSDLGLPSAARHSPLAANCHRAYFAQANRHTSSKKKQNSYYHRKKLPPHMLLDSGAKSSSRNVDMGSLSS